ncbi:MAG TPA: DedA family protein [Actinomycetes bacterium]|nr:DedA family protein [Actinomycetes bacterium]
MHAHKIADLGGLAGWVLDVIDAMGAVGVAALVALENLFPPMPSEVVLPLAGFLAGQGKLSLAAVLVAATVGSVVGALVLYWAGAALGRDRTRRIAERLPLMNADDVDLAQGWFDRHGRSAVLVGRLVPGVRSLVSIPVGIARMPLLPFVGYTTSAARATTWCWCCSATSSGADGRRSRSTATRSTTASTA